MHPDGEQLLTVSPIRARKPEPDEICAQAVDLARAAAVELAGAAYVGDHVGTDAEADRVVTHLFDCLDPAYRGWRWAVTLTRASRAKTATVAETVLLPAPSPSSLRNGFPGGSGCVPVTSAWATYCPRPPTTSGLCP